MNPSQASSSYSPRGQGPANLNHNTSIRHSHRPTTTTFPPAPPSSSASFPVWTAIPSAATSTSKPPLKPKARRSGSPLLAEPQQSPLSPSHNHSQDQLHAYLLIGLWSSSSSSSSPSPQRQQIRTPSASPAPQTAMTSVQQLSSGSLGDKCQEKLRVKEEEEEEQEEAGQKVVLPSIQSLLPSFFCNAPAAATLKLPTPPSTPPRLPHLLPQLAAASAVECPQTSFDFSSNSSLWLPQPNYNEPSASLLPAPSSPASEHNPYSRSSSPLKRKEASGQEESEDNNNTAAEGGRKKKRLRCATTEEEGALLEGVFQKTPFVRAELKSQIAKSLGWTERRVKVWFQNRRAKERRAAEKAKVPPPPSSSSQASPSGVIVPKPVVVASAAPGRC
ncbi:Aristaless-like homeobox [Balamuthia mandrillaris]